MPHTPVPWWLPHFAKPSSGCDCKYVLCEDYMGSICEISIDNGQVVGEGGNDAPPREQAIANAYLITEAPGLLATAKNLLECGEVGSRRYANALSLLRVAVQRAEGNRAEDVD